MSRDRGKVKLFNEVGGFGFITPDAGGEDLFVDHYSIRCNCFRSLVENESVEFQIQHSDDGRRIKAVDVSSPHGSSVQRSQGGGGGDGYGRSIVRPGESGHMAKDFPNSGRVDEVKLKPPLGVARVNRPSPRVYYVPGIDLQSLSNPPVPGFDLQSLSNPVPGFDLQSLSNPPVYRISRYNSDGNLRYAKIALEFYNKSHQDAEFEVLAGLFYDSLPVGHPGWSSFQKWFHVSFTATSKNLDCSDGDNAEYFFAELRRNEDTSRIDPKYCYKYNYNPGGLGHTCVICPPSMKFHPADGDYKVGFRPYYKVLSVFD